jgi:hypothetical protein
LENAIPTSKKLKDIAERFSATFPPDTLAKWEEMVKEWDADPLKPNPYVELASGKCSHVGQSHVPIFNLF